MMACYVQQQLLLPTASKAAHYEGQARHPGMFHRCLRLRTLLLLFYLPAVRAIFKSDHWAACLSLSLKLLPFTSCQSESSTPGRAKMPPRCFFCQRIRALLIAPHIMKSSSRFGEQRGATRMDRSRVQHHVVHSVQGSPSGCGRLEITRVSQVAYGGHSRSYAMCTCEL